MSAYVYNCIKFISDSVGWEIVEKRIIGDEVNFGLRI